MNDELSGVFWAGIGVGMLIGLGIGYLSVSSDWENDLIERDLAIYCPNDGEFAFKGECDE